LENFNRIVADAGETGIDAKILRPTERSKSEYVRKKTSSRYDLWFLRMSGSGLGNCFYNHYQAVALAVSARTSPPCLEWASPDKDAADSQWRRTA
jgi:hypothetical protein